MTDDIVRIDDILNGYWFTIIPFGSLRDGDGYLLIIFVELNFTKARVV